MSEYRVGFHRLALAAPLGLHMAGYFYPRLAEGVLDELTATAVTVSDGERTAALLTVDLLGVAQAVADEWTDSIARQNGLAPEAVFLACTHTHTGPVILDRKYPNDPAFNELTKRRLSDAVALALAGAAPVRAMYAGERALPGVSFVRRFLLRDGSVTTWARRGDPNVVRHVAEADNDARLIRIVREGAPEVLVANFQTHPDCVGGSLYSADFPHFVRSCVERALPGTCCAYFNGAQGNLSANTPFREAWVDAGKSIGRARRLGQQIAGAVIQLYENSPPVEPGPVRCARRRVTVGTRRDNTRLAEAERIIEINRQGRDAEELGPPAISIPLVAEAHMLKRLEHEGDSCEVNASAVVFGPVAFTGFPGEPFCGLGRRVRDASPCALTLTCCLTNGNEGYIPEENAYAEGGYENKSTKFAPGTGEQLADVLSDLLKTLTL